MTNKQLAIAILFGIFKTSVITLAVLFIADDLGLFPRK